VTAGQRLCAAVVGLELGVLSWCVVAFVRVYLTVKGKNG